MADIKAFLGRVLSDGLQRTNRYRCRLDLTGLLAGEVGMPGGQRAGSANDPFRAGVLDGGMTPAIKLLQEGLLCRTTMTPSRTFETTTVNLAGGYEEEYAVGTTYNNLDCTFLCPLIGNDPHSTATNPVLTLFHAWQNLIQNRGKFGDDADMVLSFPREYRLEQGMRLELLSGEAPDPHLTHRAPKPRISTAFEYFEVYPVTVSGTTVDWATMEEMMEVAVTFSYTHWQQVKDEDLDL